MGPCWDERVTEALRRVLRDRLQLDAQPAWAARHPCDHFTAFARFVADLPEHATYRQKVVVNETGQNGSIAQRSLDGRVVAGEIGGALASLRQALCSGGRRKALALHPEPLYSGGSRRRQRRRLLGAPVPASKELEGALRTQLAAAVNGTQAAGGKVSGPNVNPSSGPPPGPLPRKRVAILQSSPASGNFRDEMAVFVNSLYARKRGYDFIVARWPPTDSADASKSAGRALIGDTTEQQVRWLAEVSSDCTVIVPYRIEACHWLTVAGGAKSRLFDSDRSHYGASCSSADGLREGAARTPGSPPL